MSFFGRNIKKIRNAKKISQSAFADLFKLKRGSIGAYEEGRAEAKIETVIEIANYFRLSLDQLLKKELTINEIYHLNELTEKLEKTNQQRMTELTIPLILEKNRTEFLEKNDDINFLSGLQSIKIPDLVENTIAFEYTGNSLLTNYSGFSAGDILISKPLDINRLAQVADNQLFVIAILEKLFFGRITNLEEKIKITFDNPTFDVLSIEKSEIFRIWKVYRIIKGSIPIANNLEKSLKVLENKIEQLVSKQNDL